MNTTTYIQQTIAEWLMRQRCGDQFEALSSLDVSLATSQGPFRDSNEDRIAYVEVCRSTNPSSPLGIAAIADGIGGSIGGEQAAATAVAALSTYVALGDSVAGLKSLLLRAVHYANEQVFSTLRGKGGTTLSAILYGKQGAIGVNVGDSRIYAIRDTKASCLSVDDTLEAYIRPRYQDRVAPPAQVRDQRLVQFVGMGRELEPHLIELIPFQSAGETRYLLTTDGAHFLGESNIASIYRRSDSRCEMAKAIVDTARSLGSTDNATAIDCPKMMSVPLEGRPPSITMYAPGRTLTALLALPKEVGEATAVPQSTSQTALFGGDMPVEIGVKRPVARRPVRSTKTRGGATGKGKRSKRLYKTRAAAIELVSGDTRLANKKK